MKTVPVEKHWMPAERRRVGSEPRLVMAVAAVGVVFVCFFAIGRVTAPGPATPSEALSAIPVAGAGAGAGVAIPVSLSSAPPLETPAVVGHASSPSQLTSTPAPPEAVQPLVARAFPAPVQIAPPAPAATGVAPTSSAPATGVAPTSSTPTTGSAPTSPPGPSTPANGPSGAGGESPASGNATHSGGGFFDSSG
jgi:hypothetical protein